MKRIEEIDALRGFALFGILVVNLFVFHAPYSYYSEFYGAFMGFEASVVNLVITYFGGKFLFIFAFLFGYGIGLQKLKHQAHFASYFTKRMAALLLFGLLHIFLFWLGDILTSYALLGIIALPFLNLSKKAILGLGIFFLAFCPVYYLGAVLFEWPMVQMGQPVSLQEFTTVFQQGSYGDIFQLRMQELWAYMPENLVWFIPKTLGLFFMGVYAFRIQLFEKIRLKRSRYLLIALTLVGLAVIWSQVKMNVFSQFDLEKEPLWRPLLIAVNIFFETCLGFGYIIGFGCIFQFRNKITNALAKTGRLALSNYILQSIICVGVFYGFGLGQYTKWQPSQLLLFAIVVYALNILFSIVYYKYRKQGPLEWLWRKATN